MLKIALIVLIVSGQNPFPALNMNTPTVYNWAITNKIYACLMIFFLSNAIEGQLISTGAFEVTFNDVPVWSKMDVGRIPSPQELFQIIDTQLKFSQGNNANGAGIGNDQFSSKVGSGGNEYYTNQ